MSSLSLIDPFSSNSTSVPKSKPTPDDFNAEFGGSPVAAPVAVIKQGATKENNNNIASLSLTPFVKKHTTQTLFPKSEKKIELVIEEASPPVAAAEPKLFKEEKLNQEVVELNETNRVTRELSTKLHNVLVEKINLTKSSCEKNIEMTKESIEHMCNSTRSATTAFNETVAKVMEAQKACMLQFVSAAQEFGTWVHKESKKLSSKKRKQRDDAEYPPSETEEDEEDDGEEDTPMSGSEESDLDPVPIQETKRKHIPVASSAPRVTKKTIEQSNKKAKAATVPPPQTAPAATKTSSSSLFKPKPSSGVANGGGGGRQLPDYAK